MRDGISVWHPKLHRIEADEICARDVLPGTSETGAWHLCSWHLCSRNNLANVPLALYPPRAVAGHELFHLRYGDAVEIPRNGMLEAARRYRELQ